ncbi:MAG: hypothetical protein U0Q16_29260 [Bryobacteraceae bacterium]
MAEIEYRGRRAHRLSNGVLTVTITVEGGHIASILHAGADVNPLWTPQWPSMEPSAYDAARHGGAYGGDAEAKLLAGIFGHNLCLDLFGGPSEAEAAAGMTVHGESSIALYEVEESPGALVARSFFREAGLRFERRLALNPGSSVLRITEAVENVSACDRPSAWTQHVSLGAPFVEPGVTQFRLPGTRSKVLEADFAGGKGYQKIGAEFDWPMCPRADGGVTDLRLYPGDARSAGYTATLMDPAREQAHFIGWHPKWKLAFGYAWKQTDFPWIGRWEENRLRELAPWDGREITCGMEFGVSPMPESRKQMIERGSLFGVPGYRWLPARQKVTVEYCAFAALAEKCPESPTWSGDSVRFDT